MYIVICNKPDVIVGMRLTGVFVIDTADTAVVTNYVKDRKPVLSTCNIK